MNDGKQPSLPTNKSWAEAVLNKNNVPADAFVNNLTTDGPHANDAPAIVSDEEDDDDEPQMQKEKPKVQWKDVAIESEVKKKSVEPASTAVRKKQFHP